MGSGVESAEDTVGRTLRIGIAVWLATAILQVALNGISLDETATAAPIITGAIQYPAGHPHDIYYRSTYSLLQYVSAGLWLIWPDAFGISALYNVAFLFVSAFAPFVLTLVITQRPTWAWVAGALALTEAALPFDGQYPLYVYPFPFSNGHIGMHMIVLVAALLMARRYRSAGFLLGIFPALHGPLAAVAWVWAGLWLLTGGDRPTGADRRRFLLSGAAGLVICIALGIVILARGVASPLPPYIASEGSLAIYRQFTLHSDVHRRTPTLASFGYLVNPLAFFLIGALTIALRRSLGDAERGVRRLRAVLDLGVIAWALILVAYIYRQLFGTLPVPLEMAMPFRIANLTALLLIPLTVAALANVEERLDDSRRWLLPIIVAAALVVSAVYSIRNPRLVSAYILIVMWGILVGGVLRVSQDRSRTIAVAFLVLLLPSILLAGGGLRPVIGLLAGFAGTAVLLTPSTRLTFLRQWGDRLGARRIALVTLSACALAVVIGVWRRGPDDPTGPVDQTWRRMSAADRALRSWISIHTAPNEAFLAPIWPYAKVQAKLGRPQLVEWETMYLMTYAPGNAAVINQLSRDVYGVDYADSRTLDTLCEGRVNVWCEAWSENWKRRSRAEWQALGRKYAVRRVMAPTEWQIDLPRDTTVGRWAMYRIP